MAPNSEVGAGFSGENNWCAAKVIAKLRFAAWWLQPILHLWNVDESLTFTPSNTAFVILNCNKWERCGSKNQDMSKNSQGHVRDLLRWRVAKGQSWLGTYQQAQSLRTSGFRRPGWYRMTSQPGMTRQPPAPRFSFCFDARQLKLQSAAEQRYIWDAQK